MPTKMSIWGIGGKMAVIIFPYAVFTIILTGYIPDLFRFPEFLNTLIIILGWLLILSGLVFFIATERVFMNGFKQGILMTTGTFSLCRNPIYASWILFFIPGIGFLFNSWLTLTASLLMYILFKLNIHREEQVLLTAFGDEYLSYKKQVNELFPFPRKFKA